MTALDGLLYRERFFFSLLHQVPGRNNLTIKCQAFSAVDCQGKQKPSAPEKTSIRFKR